MLDAFIHQPRVAYFSMEIALQNEIPTYAGGLGVLAGDTLYSAADLEIPMVAVTLVSRGGSFRQEIDADGRQTEQPDGWNPADFTCPLEAKVAVTIEGRQVWVGGWLYVLKGHMNGRQPVILLDTDLDENTPEDRTITHYLYGGDQDYRLKQEIVLGIGGMRMLQALGFEIRQYHMNEGHSALLTVDLLRRYAYSAEEVRPGEPKYDIPRVRDLCIFTTHTPVEAGHDKFDYSLVERLLGAIVDGQTLKHFGGEDRLNMTRLALNLSEYINGVAKRHAEVSRKMFPGYHVHAVTNGVHPFRWTSQPFKTLYNRHLPGWCHQPELLMRAECCLADADIREAHQQAKQILIDKATELCGIELSPDTPIIGFARRMTAYKRPDLLFTDLERLKAIARSMPIQIVLAGKAHPRDADGKRLIEQLHRHIGELSGTIPMAFLPDYDLEIALALTGGCDLWLNTPLPPREASGTSGMKAAFNGVPSLSVLDGWWVEGCIEGVTGWAIGDGGAGHDDAAALYEKLEKSVLPLYYQNPSGWIGVMKQAISKNAAYFNSHRMMRRYASEAYLR
ncbi:alpha-glucan family phosphorylase [Methylohalobius crimeensis]|uniref:alpha-glucan family phosphorylase n=1 Tax=Methylohalobius crimeensis TaxID=244365 RepID=UPI0003B634E6|nr:alpha-glucan family phosphorylase [Methylohalobius crimeensis]